MKQQKITKKQIQFLRGKAHTLPALVQIGKEGLTENLFKALETELLHHELIKVRIGTNSSVDKNDAAERLPTTTGSTLVQMIGKTLILYRPNPKLPATQRLRLPGI